MLQKIDQSALKRKLDFQTIPTVVEYYEKKGSTVATMVPPFMQMFKEMRPIPSAEAVKSLIKAECGAGQGKEMQFIRGKEKNSSQGGKLVTATCKSCNKFKLVWRATRTQDFTVREKESNIDHGVVDEAGDLIGPCLAATPEATAV